MTPFPAVVTLRDSRVHAGASEGGYISAEVERVINEFLCLRTIL